MSMPSSSNPGPGVSRTKSTPAGEYDLNVIVARCRAGHSSIPANSKQGVFADVSTVPDFKSALSLLARVKAEPPKPKKPAKPADPAPVAGNTSPAPCVPPASNTPVVPISAPEVKS